MANFIWPAIGFRRSTVPRLYLSTGIPA
jgi:hypothetical protein